MIDLDALAAQFPPDTVEWRIGATNKDKTQGIALAYIDARHVMNRLDEVCGPAGWQCRYSHANTKTVCEIGIKVDGEWVWKSDGAGDTEFEGVKGALSDAFKRAAVRWKIARYLYDLDAPWVNIEPAGRSYKIPVEERKKLQRKLRETYWRGPLLITALKEKAHEIRNAIEECQTSEDLSVVTTEYEVVWDQLEIDQPIWFDKLQGLRATKLDQINARSE